MALWQNKRRRKAATRKRLRARSGLGISPEAQRIMDLFEASKEEELENFFVAPCDNEQPILETKNFFIWYLTPEQLSAAKAVADAQTLELLRKFKKGVGIGWIMGPTHATLAKERVGQKSLGVLVSFCTQQELERKRAPGRFIVATDKYDLLMSQ